MSKIRFKKLRLWLVYPVFIIYPFLARITNFSFILGLILMFLGLGIRFWASGYISKSRVLAISGPYAHMRNPLYLGNFFLGLGICAVSNNLWLIIYYILSFSILYWGTIEEEQKDLEEKFGDAYRDYKAHVPMFLPALKPYKNLEKKRFDIRLSFRNGEFIRICGFSLLMSAFYLWHSFLIKRQYQGGGDKIVIFLFVAFLGLLWFNIFIRRKSQSRSF